MRIVTEKDSSLQLTRHVFCNSIENEIDTIKKLVNSANTIKFCIWLEWEGS